MASILTPKTSKHISLFVVTRDRRYAFNKVP